MKNELQRSYTLRILTYLMLGMLYPHVCEAQQSSATLDVWPGLAPGESATDTGTALPARASEKKPITRLVNIRKPTLDVFLAEEPNGTGILVLPGGGFAKVVPDLEGSEVAPFLNKLGISVFVLNYRTSEVVGEGEPLWKRPVQDAQRALRMLHERAKSWELDPARIGVLAFSAGGQAGAVLHTGEHAHYESADEIDTHPFRPDFSLLIYPWRILDSDTGQLLPEIKVTEGSGPAFIVHTHDDNSTAVGAASLYIALKQKNIPAELHVYQNGGHGYGVRPRKNSVIHTWTDRARDWLIVRGLGRAD